MYGMLYGKGNICPVLCTVTNYSSSSQWHFSLQHILKQVNPIKIGAVSRQKVKVKAAALPQFNYV
jgi:hypothetical protein